MTNLEPRPGGLYIRSMEQILYHYDKEIFYLIRTDQITEIDDLIKRFSERVYAALTIYSKKCDRGEDFDDDFIIQHVRDKCREINLSSRSENVNSS